MSRSEQKVVQYLNEAHASEMALVRVLQSQIAMTPRGTYRCGLETHLGETRNHAERVQTRLGELGQGGNPLQLFGGVAESVAGQALALAKTPLDLLRGSGGEEKVLKNAKDACATEALEIATYTAIERLARSVGDEQTAKLAASIRADEEKMLERILREIPKLTGAVVGADVEGDPSYDVTKTGAADARGRPPASDAAAKAEAHRAPGAQGAGRRAGRGPGQGRRRVAVRPRDRRLRQADRGGDRHEALRALADRPRQGRLLRAQHENRTTVLERVSSLRGDEPWPGYDELTAAEVQTALGEADDDRVKAVRSYERAHKARAGVLKATERELATPSTGAAREANASRAQPVRARPPRSQGRPRPCLRAGRAPPRLRAAGASTPRAPSHANATLDRHPRRRARDPCRRADERGSDSCHRPECARRALGQHWTRRVQPEHPVAPSSQPRIDAPVRTRRRAAFFIHRGQRANKRVDRPAS